MTNNNGHGIDLGMEFLKSIYMGTGVDTKEAQPIYILPRDTVRTFLHEKIGLFGIQSRVLGLAGVEITLLASLATASFTDFLGIKGNVIKGTFIAFSVIFGVLLIKDLIKWWRCKDEMDVDALAENLGSRGSIIPGVAPKAKIEG